MFSANKTINSNRCAHWEKSSQALRAKALGFSRYCKRYTPIIKMRYFLVFLTFFSSLSAGCSLEIPKGFQAFASFVESENKYIIRFPLTDSAQEPRYISSLTLEINNVASADLEYTQVDGFVRSSQV
ncbi:hypothetical protein [Planctobacterium marinum]|uniref:hypothetical protein n=1 Tax=Planctobacterium marinum TaxID=1631968 RepID=UPI001E3A5A40|nr:hypothetical protein [Planctobacterium marinum]MCC2605649.1 hypothetical protein [Planctobacterium marinum]